MYESPRSSERPQIIAEPSSPGRGVSVSPRLRVVCWCQSWLDVLFLHWRIPADRLRSHIPAPLEIASHDGSAWVSAVLFRLLVRPRWLPFLPGLSGMVEVNLRTYVSLNDMPGIWFLSVHGDNRWAIRLARLLTPMPYELAAMRYERDGNRFHFDSSGPTPTDFRLALQHSPFGEATEAADDSLDAWLLERYRLYIRGRADALLQAEVDHPRWLTQEAEVAISAMNIGTPLGLDLSSEPDRAHYSPGVQARFGAFRSAIL